MQHVEAMVRGTEPVPKAAKVEKVEDASIQAAAAELGGTELFRPDELQRAAQLAAAMYTRQQRRQDLLFDCGTYCLV